MRRLPLLLAAVLVLLGIQVLPASAGQQVPEPVTPIRHFVVLMQSNHSFDNYFGTYPGADGLPAGTCLPADTARPDPAGCVKPFRLGRSSVTDLAHGPAIQAAQYNAGKMDGFVSAYRHKGLDGVGAMGHYDGADLPYYWNVADRHTLFDRFFSSAPSGRDANRFYWVAGVPPPGQGDRVPPGGYGDVPTIFDRLEQQGISWKFYVENYDPHANVHSQGQGGPPGQLARVPLLNYPRFVDNPNLASHIVDLREYQTDLRQGRLPSVAYVATAGASENPPSRVQAGQDLVRSMTSELAKSQYWNDSAFLWTYDGWGGWYDHVRPPAATGFRVPALLISAYSRRGQVNHTPLDYTAVLSFIEHNWRLPPLGDRDARSPGLTSAFDFTSRPRPPELISSQRVPPTHAHAVVVVYLIYGAAVLLAICCGLGVLLPEALRRRKALRDNGITKAES